MPVYALGDHEPRIHVDAYIHPDATVIGNVEIGAESSVWPQAVLRGDYGRISIGARTSIQDGTVIHATQELPTIIGDEVTVGHLAHLECCVVEDRSLVGSMSVVLHRAVVRTGALVGANAVVPNDMEVPSRSMALGVPAEIRPDSVPADAFEWNVITYVANAKRYQGELRRLD
ncbi:MAG TPA: gamma carbonic anhydrase family protein [Acidimicrobiales bacterium]|jgi:carbonic anhydrase/acetyltransferase-like protein (isoleucine patch superfamily)